MGSALSQPQQKQLQQLQEQDQKHNSRERAETTSVLPAGHIHAANVMMGSAEIELQFRSTYEFIKILGRGSSAEVHLVRHKETQKQYAVKIVRKTNQMNDSQSMKTEVNIMKKLQHRYLLNMYELYETSETIWMVLELANGGDLMHGLSLMQTYSERNVSKLFRQLLLGVKHLQEKGIVHRDLKMDNLLYSVSRYDNELVDSTKERQEKISLLAEEMEIKIADFGLSALTKLKRNETNMNELKHMKLLKEMWGTVEYFAPEVYQKAYGFQADIWSLGCILYEMLTGEIAFPSREVDTTTIMEKLLLHGQKPKRAFELKSNYMLLSKEAKSLIKGMLKRNPTKRFDIDDCLKHPWITGEGLSEDDFSHYDYNHQELVEAKKIIDGRSQRRHRRYDALVEELKRDELRNQALARIQVQ